MVALERSLANLAKKLPSLPKQISYFGSAPEGFLGVSTVFQRILVA